MSLAGTAMSFERTIGLSVMQVRHSPNTNGKLDETAFLYQGTGTRLLLDESSQMPLREGDGDFAVSRHAPPPLL